MFGGKSAPKLLIGGAGVVVGTGVVGAGFPPKETQNKSNKLHQ